MLAKNLKIFAVVIGTLATFTILANLIPQDTGTDVGSSAAAGTPGPATASMDPLEIMRANTCLVCHLFNGEGIQMGPPLDRIGARVDADYIRESILNPAAGASEGFEELTTMMPLTFGDQLTSGQLEILVEFLVGQR
jgi:hypothetical protein